MSEANISYKGFKIIRLGTMYVIEGRPGNFSTLKLAKGWIDSIFDKRDKNKSIPFHY